MLNNYQAFFASSSSASFLSCLYYLAKSLGIVSLGNTLVTIPCPIVFPESLKANLKPSSIATGYRKRI